MNGYRSQHPVDAIDPRILMALLSDHNRKALKLRRRQDRANLAGHIVLAVGAGLLLAVILIGAATLAIAIAHLAKVGVSR